MNKNILGLTVLIVVITSTLILKSQLEKPQILNKNLANLLVVYTAYDQHGKIALSRLGKENDGGYAVPVKALEATDVMLGYGIADDNSFEEQFSDRYHKPSYGFDCGIKSINSKNKLFTLIQQCIANDNTLYLNQMSSHKISSFTQQLKNLDLRHKKLFIKMDIEGAEYEAFEEILNHAEDITGIVLEIHFPSAEQTDKATGLLSQINQNFLLLHLHGNNCTRTFYSTDQAVGEIPSVLELTYINKQFVQHYHIAHEQKHPTTLDMQNCLSKPDTEFEILKG